MPGYPTPVLCSARVSEAKGFTSQCGSGKWAVTAVWRRSTESTLSSSTTLFGDLVTTWLQPLFTNFFTSLSRLSPRNRLESLNPRFAKSKKSRSALDSRLVPAIRIICVFEIEFSEFRPCRRFDAFQALEPRFLTVDFPFGFDSGCSGCVVFVQKRRGVGAQLLGKPGFVFQGVHFVWWESVVDIAQLMP